MSASEPGGIRSGEVRRSLERLDRMPGVMTHVEEVAMTGSPVTLAVSGGGVGAETVLATSSAFEMGEGDRLVAHAHWRVTTDGTGGGFVDTKIRVKRAGSDVFVSTWVGGIQNNNQEITRSGNWLYTSPGKQTVTVDLCINTAFSTNTVRVLDHTRLLVQVFRG